MVRQNIAYTWDHGQSRKGTLPTAGEFETLIEERRYAGCHASVAQWKSIGFLIRWS